MTTGCCVVFYPEFVPIVHPPGTNKCPRLMIVCPRPALSYSCHPRANKTQIPMKYFQAQKSIATIRINRYRIETGKSTRPTSTMS